MSYFTLRNATGMHLDFIVSDTSNTHRGVLPAKTCEQYTPQTTVQHRASDLFVQLFDAAHPHRPPYRNTIHTPTMNYVTISCPVAGYSMCNPLSLSLYGLHT